MAGRPGGPRSPAHCSPPGAGKAPAPDPTRPGRQAQARNIHFYVAACIMACMAAAVGGRLGFSGRGASGFVAGVLLAASTASVVARLRGAAAALASIIGEPPLRPLLDPHAPSRLLRTLDVSSLLAAAFVVATIVMLVFAFTAGSATDALGPPTAALSVAQMGLEGADVVPALEDDLQCDCAADQEREGGLIWRLKLVIVAYLAVFGDRLFDIKGPLRHALISCL
mmetsp:Transcript_67895/g.191379  ORF Transcript_67895/g.191379 Transcript_67895/m.191379 type:complete len:225 (+) Transcript_67895:144-818(+)